MIQKNEDSKMDKEQKLTQYTPFTHEEFYTRYYVHRVGASSIVLNSENKILLVKEIRKNKYIWGLPGGLIERQEAIVTGLIREVKEETNCTVNPYAILGITNWAGKSIFESDTHSQSGIHFTMASDYLSGVPTPDKVEVFETGFFSVDQLDELKVHSSIKTLIEAIKEKKFIKLDMAQYTNEDMYRYIFSP